MRVLWILPVGFLFALFILLVTSPMQVLTGGMLANWLRGDVFSALSGESVFGIRDLDGRLDGRLVNVGFHTLWIRADGDPRPRRLLLRLEVANGDVFANRMGEGRIRFDAWPMDGAADLHRPPLYSVVAVGRMATVEETVLKVDHGSRHSVYGLADGSWLYDYDVPPVVVPMENDMRRVVVLSSADADVVPGGIAVLSLASDRKTFRRLVIVAQDATRARLLRSGLASVHPVLRSDDPALRSIDLALSVGIVRLPLVGGDFDLARAQLPQGLDLVELRPWDKRPH
jgi:hypothetical protein